MSAPRCQRCRAKATHAICVEAGVVLTCARHAEQVAAALEHHPVVTVGRRRVRLDVPEGVRRWSRTHVTIAEYAAMVGVSHKTIRGMIERGELTAQRFGRVLRIDLDRAREETTYRPAGAGGDAPPRSPRPRPAKGEFSRRARGSV